MLRPSTCFLHRARGGSHRPRPANQSNRYRVYLPFPMAFTSNDGFHARTAPLFLGEDEAFILGSDLKVDLAKLDARYSARAGEPATALHATRLPRAEYRIFARWPRPARRRP